MTGGRFSFDGPPLWRTAAAAAATATLLAGAHLTGQTPTPTSLTFTSGAVCTGGEQTFPVSLALPPGSAFSQVDVFLLFDDTGSFAGFVPTVASIFSNLVSSLEATLPGVSFGFGVGRFEDYGGSGAGFSSENTTGRPFTLNQPIVTAATAGGTAARDALISTALSRTAPGFGGDGPESGLEGLYQVATGAGFDGNGNGSRLDSGAAGAVTTQIAPGTSGDVPPFSSNVAPASGTLGGVGWRTNSLRLVILATDICSVTALPPGSIPPSVSGAGGTSQPTSAFACTSVTPGLSRFGFISNSTSVAGNTVTNAIAPAGAAALQQTVSALNALGIRVLGMGPGAAPTTSTTPSASPSTWLSAIARLTGGLDAGGNPLVFSTSVSLPVLTTAIAGAISTSATLPLDITLGTTPLPPGISFAFAPTVQTGVPPGGTAPFTVTLTSTGTGVNGSFDIRFLDLASSAVIGSIPTTIACAGGLACDIDGDADVDAVDITLIRQASGSPAGPGDPRDTNGDGRINVADTRFCAVRCTRAGCS